MGEESSSAPPSKGGRQQVLTEDNEPSEIRNNSWSSSWLSSNSGEDDDLSVTSSYQDPSDNDLNLFQGAALITADCLGTGILALPADIQVLGTAFGLAFLVFNLPVNLYAGTVLCTSAQQVEQAEEEDTTTNKEEPSSPGVELHVGGKTHVLSGDGIVRVSGTGRKKNYESISPTEDKVATTSSSKAEDGGESSHDSGKDNVQQQLDDEQQQHHHYETATFDFIGMTHALFHHPRASRIVMAVYYTNIFLVLGNYILVMSHAVAAFLGEDRICLPTAGMLASTLMFGVSQLRTMANLGRSASIISLSALAVVVAQCLYALQHNEEYINEGQEEATGSTNQEEDSSSYSEEVTLLRQFSALASIGFAVGSQKLLLNIRHEFRERRHAPTSLGISLSVFGAVYVTICLFAGPNPPSFLFDAIAPGWNRRLAGLLLWIHVVVSYAINSQAICSSIDRLFFHRVSTWNLQNLHKTRWLVLTLMFAVSSYLVANAVPFFKDLVALIGALTSVPLTLLLPAVFHRRVTGVPIWKPTRTSFVSWALLVFALIFTLTGLFGALGSIELDWAGHGPPFACR